MVKKRIGVKLFDEVYEERLAKYLMKHYADVFNVVRGSIDEEIVITDKGINVDEEKGLFFYLTDEVSEKQDIYRYQSIENIMKRILYECEEQKARSGNPDRTKLTVFMSLDGSSKIRSICRQHIKRLGEKSRVLYIAYDMFGRIHQEIEELKVPDEKYNMSTICYLMERDNDKEINISKLKACIGQSEGYDYLYEFVSPTHMLEMSGQFSDFIVKLCTLGIYENVVVALIDKPTGMQDILNQANEIILVNDNVENDNRRVKEYFNNYLNDIGLDETRKVIDYQYEC